MFHKSNKIDQMTMRDPVVVAVVHRRSREQADVSGDDSGVVARCRATAPLGIGRSVHRERIYIYRGVELHTSFFRVSSLLAARPAGLLDA